MKIYVLYQYKEKYWETSTRAAECAENEKEAVGL